MRSVFLRSTAVPSTLSDAFFTNLSREQDQSPEASVNVVDEAVDRILSEALTECEMVKLNSIAIWQRRRLVATKRWLYLLASKGTQADSRFEIVDAIPLHEICKICDMTENFVLVTKETDAFLLSKVRLRRRSSIQGSMRTQSDLVLAAGLVDSQGPKQQSESVSKRRGSNHGFSFAARKNFESVLKGTEITTAFEVHTKKDGYNLGRTYYFSASSMDLRTEWKDALEQLSRHAKKSFQRNNAVMIFQSQARAIYQSVAFQGFIVLAITANFFLTLTQAQLGDGSQLCAANSSIAATTFARASDLQNKYDRLDLAFTIIFAAELMLNFVAHAFWPFFQNNYNLFDFLVVSISIGVLFVSSTSNSLVKQLRILRVFRVLRVFGRIGQLREIVNAITTAILPTAQAMFIVVVVIAIYATIGSQLYAEEYPDGFCDFFHAFYTMFEVVAYSAPDGIMAFDSNGRVRFGPVAFIYSYVCIVVFVLLQVMVAVLLDSFYRAKERDNEEAARAQAAEERLAESEFYPMDPLMERLALAFDCGENLALIIDAVFNVLDTDDTMSLSFTELAEGLFKAYGVRLRIEDYDVMTDHGALCDDSQELGREQFQFVMLRQLRAFMQRRATEALYNTSIGSDSSSLLGAVKFTMIELDRTWSEVGAFRDQSEADMVEVLMQLAHIERVLLQLEEAGAMPRSL